MISDPALAEQTYRSLLEAQIVLARSVAALKDRCPPEEYSAYKHVLAHALGTIVADGLMPLREKHPTLAKLDAMLNQPP